MQVLVSAAVDTSKQRLIASTCGLKCCADLSCSVLGSFARSDACFGQRCPDIMGCSQLQSCIKELELTIQLRNISCACPMLAIFVTPEWNVAFVRRPVFVHLIFNRGHLRLVKLVVSTLARVARSIVASTRWPQAMQDPIVQARILAVAGARKAERVRPTLYQ